MREEEKKSDCVTFVADPYHPGSRAFLSYPLSYVHAKRAIPSIIMNASCVYQQQSNIRT